MLPCMTLSKQRAGSAEFSAPWHSFSTLLVCQAVLPLLFHAIFPCTALVQVLEDCVGGADAAEMNGDGGNPARALALVLIRMKSAAI